MFKQWWPPGLKFQLGDPVERCALPNGNPPAYRFPGRVCGWYATNDFDTRVGYVVSRDGDPGCKQIFTENMLQHRKEK